MRRARIPTMCERRSASLRWGEGRQDVKTYGHTGRSLPVWLFLLPENCISVLWPVESRLNKGSRWKSGADALL